MEVIERHGNHEVIIINNSIIQLFVNPGTSHKNRALVLTEWYREQLKLKIPDLLNRWQSIIGEQVADWGIKKMKTKWGSCNIKERRIWLNLELAKKPIECLEYVLVHELVHLLERHHNERFQAYMDQYLPHWRQCREILNREPLGDI
jgi:predicted metal-dependent hydrolase